MQHFCSVVLLASRVFSNRLLLCMRFNFNCNLRPRSRLLVSEVSEVVLESGQTQQACVNPLTCCEVINSSVISLEEEHGPTKT